MLTLALLGGLAAPTVAQQRVANADPAAVEDTRAAEAVLARVISVHVEGMPLEQAIKQVVSEGGGRVVYRSDDVARYTERVTLTLSKVTVGSALDRLLAGTLLTAKPLAEGRIGILAAKDGGVSLAGVIAGRVIDSATKQPVVGATVALTATSYGARTIDDGTFRLTGIPAGTYRLSVRRIGYRSYTTSVVVTDGASVTLTVRLTAANTQLSEVVTTALGKQRRVEVGNVISHLNVDSIAQTAPVTSLTDLLSGRAPGVQIVQTNGLVGSATAIRIRGQSSVTMASDPIIIVDGVRQDNSAGGKYSGNFGAYTTPSRINDLDYSQIESIDILKGPAASTEYGTDAANGVIVITTKHGKVSAPQWHGSAERGWSEVPTDFPDYWYSWGHFVNDPDYSGPTGCPLVSQYWVSQTNGLCVVDSVTHDNPLNHKETTIFGSGLRQKLSLDVGGGTDVVRYYVAGSNSHDDGTARLPLAFHSQARALNFPSTVFDPNTLGQSSVRANLMIRLGQTADVNVSGAYLSTKQQSPLGVQSTLIPTFLDYVPVILDSAHFYGYEVPDNLAASPLNLFGAWTGENTSRSTIGLTGDWRPIGWFTGHVTAGLDHGSQRDLTYWSPQAYLVSNYVSNSGWLGVGNLTTDIASSDARGSVTLPVLPLLRSTTSFGLQIVNETSQGVSAFATGVTEANTSLNGVPNPQVTQVGDGHATVGGYLEEQLNVAERLFLTGAVRLDGASGFGGDYHTTAYPKVGLSWLALTDGPVTLRLRTALGAAGQQPDNGSTVQTYMAIAQFVDGSNQSTTQIVSSGNPLLKPERSQELEGGFDLGLWDNRVNLEFSHYTKSTKDALVPVGLGATLDNLRTQENLGDIRNWGNEVTLQASVLQRDPVTLDFTLNASANRNKLVRIAKGIIVQPDGYMGNERQVVGYPLYGYWAQRVTYDDANGDGVLSLDEVHVADTATYIGSSLPTVETSLSSRLGLFHGALQFNALFDHRTGGVVESGGYGIGTSSQREANDSTAPLWMQARSIASQLAANRISSLNFQTGWFVRFRELSMTYAVPHAWIRAARVSNVSVTTAVRNLALWSHSNLSDPESSDPGSRTVFSSNSIGASNDSRADLGNAIPLPRTWVIRCNVDF
jgi:TonB-linked SusC/RagA family outer membrane protein